MSPEIVVAKTIKRHLQNQMPANSCLAGVCRWCARFGGSGSLILDSDIIGQAHTTPFVIGQVDPARAYVHVFDDTSLDIVMKTLDTVSDFVAYLCKPAPCASKEANARRVEHQKSDNFAHNFLAMHFTLAAREEAELAAQILRKREQLVNELTLKLASGQLQPSKPNDNSTHASKRPRRRIRFDD